MGICPVVHSPIIIIFLPNQVQWSVEQVPWIPWIHSPYQIIVCLFWDALVG